MSYTLQSKKRKFNRVLDSISKSVTPQAAAQHNNAIAPPSSERLAAPPSIKKVRLSDGPNDGIDIRTSTSKISEVSSVPATGRPNFVPWDRERFLERLETFRKVDRWSPKPSAINEVQWAKRGWSCTDVMRVTCVGGCGALLVVKLPDEIDELDDSDRDKIQERKQVREKLVEEYCRLLAEGHSENCPWRSKGCDDTIHHLPLANPDMALSGLRKRYFNNVLKVGSKLPSRNTIETPETLDLEGLIPLLPPKILNPDEDPFTPAEQEDPGQQNMDDGSISEGKGLNSGLEIDQSAFALALFGWDAVADGSTGLVECRACFRRLGLWMYKPKENGDITVYNKLAVADEHMDYCPWVNAKAQSGIGKAAERAGDLHNGWELVSQAIKTKHRRRVGAGISSESVSTDAPAGSPNYTATDEETRKAQDKEWWSKLRRVRQALILKAPKSRRHR
jgi:hypothetical protein